MALGFTYSCGLGLGEEHGWGHRLPAQELRRGRAHTGLRAKVAHPSVGRKPLPRAASQAHVHPEGKSKEARGQKLLVLRVRAPF